MAGGYGRDIHTTVAVHLRTLQQGDTNPGRPGRVLQRLQECAP
jgi:hypothetical protein